MRSRTFCLVRSIVLGSCSGWAVRWSTPPSSTPLDGPDLRKQEAKPNRLPLRPMAGQHFDHGESWRRRSQVEANLTEYC
jgi:hypothetical protein